MRANSTTDEAFATFALAREAQPDWAALGVRARRAYLLDLPAWIAAHADDLADTIARDTGKTRFDALSAEVLPAALAIDHCLRRANRYLRPQRLRGGSALSFNKRSTLHRVPWGVVGIIAPWNYPLSIPMFDIAAALLAGNTVVFKTAPETQAVGAAIDTMFAAAGLPGGVFNQVRLDGPVAGEVFLGPGGVDKLAFTGSVPVGRWLAARAAERLVPVSLELGGNDAMIVCDDANLERAANGAAWAGLQNAGQTCAAVERVYCARAVHESFLDLLKTRVGALRVGTDIGAMCTTRQRDKVREQIDDALAQGAEILVQAPAPEHGNFLPATVLVKCHHGMRIVREETFGPVLVVMPVDDDDQAVEYANDTEYGLTASVWSNDRARAARIAQRLQAGVVTLNDHLLSHGMAETPWGGFKSSGTGRTHGRAGFDAMTQTRVIVDERFPRLPRNAFWYPHDEALYEALRGTLDALFARPWLTRIRHLPAVLRLLLRMLR